MEMPILKKEITYKNDEKFKKKRGKEQSECK